MGDDRPDDIVEPGRAKRPPPTLELSATEMPRDEPAAADESISDSGPTPDDQASKRRSGGVAVAALSGAFAGAIIAGLAWFANSTWPSPAPESPPPPPPQVQKAAVDDLSARLATLEARPLPATPPPVTVAAPAPPPDLSGITARLDALEKAAAAMRDETAALRAQSTQALATASEAQKDVQSQPAPVAPDLSGITTRLAAVEAKIQGLDAKIAEQTRKPVDDQAARRAAIASSLDAQVRSGEPFVPALAVAKALSPDGAKFAPLDPFAATGVTSASVLAQALLELPQLAPPASTATTGGLMARLKSSASKLVTIERTDSPNADNAVFARAADAARRDDLAGAVRELAALPPAERAAVQPWLDRVAAREAARAASRLFANESLAAIKATP